MTVALALSGTPWINAYRFSADTGWGTRYADPGTSAALSPSGLGVAYGLDNTRLLLSGSTGDTTGVRIYNWSANTGYGTRNLQTFSNPQSLTPTRSGRHMLVCGLANVAEFNYSSTGFGSQVFSVSGAWRSGTYIWDDRLFVVGEFSGNAFQIYNRASTPTSLSRTAVATPLGFTMSPVTHSGNRVLAMVASGGVAAFFRINSDGTVASTVTSTIGGNVSRVMFDKAGRLIVGRTINQIDIYTLNSAGAQTLVQTITNLTSVSYTGGAVTSLEYDEDSDVLFVGSTSSPFIQAYKMGGVGFLSRFSNPASLPPSAVNDIALQYPTWKYTAN